MKPSQLILIGFGAVCKAMMTAMCVTNPNLAFHLPILIIDPKTLNKSEIYKKLRRNNDKVSHLQVKITENNYHDIFKNYIHKNAIVVDLAWRVDTACLIQECQNKHCLYINTAIDNWSHNKTPLFVVKQEILNNIKYPKTKMTAIINFGINPGTISIITKKLLELVAKKSNDKDALALVEENKYNLLAQHLGLTLIQIAERDNQVSKHTSDENRLVNTWSIIGFIDEAFINSAVSWGTHEKLLPIMADLSPLKTVGQLVLPVMGYQTRTKSYEPKGGVFTGYGITHAECYSLVDLLTVGDPSRPIYRPSVYYSYLIPDTAKLLCHYGEYSLDTHFTPKAEHVLRSDEIENGYDSVGCLAFFRQGSGSQLKKYWMGTILSNTTVRQLSPEINATCLQVGISALAAIEWMLMNPHRGIIEPEVVDTDFIIEYTHEWLGEFYFEEVTDKCPIDTDQYSDLVSCPANLFK